MLYCLEFLIRATSAAVRFVFDVPAGRLLIAIVLSIHFKMTNRAGVFSVTGKGPFIYQFPAPMAQVPFQ